MRGIFPIRRLTPACFGAIILAALCSSAVAAPRQLYNKSIEAGWTVSSVRTGSDGRAINWPIGVTHIVYISSTGRLFERGSRGTGGKRRESENAPGAGRNAGGEATGLHFEGARLVGTTAFAQGARRWVVSFDPSFTSCSVKVVFGRDAVGLSRRGVDGAVRRIDSISVSGETCSIREGNAFAR